MQQPQRVVVYEIYRLEKFDRITNGKNLFEFVHDLRL